MSLKTRVEYVYPKMGTRMVDSVSHMGIFHRIPFNEDIVNWNEEEFSDHVLSKKYKTYRRIEKWKKCANIYSLNLRELRWDDDIISSLADYLCNNPDVIPYFIEKSTVDIIGLFLGTWDFNTNSSGVLCMDRPCERRITDVMYNASAHEFRYMIFEAQRKFTLFANVISRILDRDINLDEIKIVQLFPRDTYANSKGNPWFEGLLFDHFTRADRMRFTKDELTDTLSFVTLSEFFKCVAKVADLGSLLDFTTGEVPPLKTLKLGTIIPEVFDFDEESHKIEDYGEENLVLVSAVCREMCEKLARVKENAENIVLTKHIEQLNEELVSKRRENAEPDYTSIKDTIDSLFEEIVGSASRDKENHLNKLIGILKSFGLDIARIEPTEPNIGDLAFKVDAIDKRLGVVEDEITEIKNRLKEYIEYGGENPLKKDIPITREEVIRIISEYKPTTMAARARKMNLLSSLKILAVGAALAGALSTCSLQNDQVSIPTNLPVPEESPKVSQQVVIDVPKDEDVIASTEPSNSDDIIVVEDDLKPLEEVVLEVIIGKWGNGEDRVQKLEEAGYDSLAIQNNVNRILLEGISVNSLRSIEDIAIEVIQGKWGSDEKSQMERLTAIGIDYDTVKRYIINENLEKKIKIVTSGMNAFTQ